MTVKNTEESCRTCVHAMWEGSPTKKNREGYCTAPIPASALSWHHTDKETLRYNQPYTADECPVYVSYLLDKKYKLSLYAD